MPKRLQKSSVKKRVPVRSVSKIKTYQPSEKPDQVGKIILLAQLITVIQKSRLENNKVKT